jgi:iron(III) transport system substrate-binding protein
MNVWVRIAALVALSSGLVAAAHAKDQGADRQAKLLEAAKREGEVSLYYIFPNLDVVTTAFTNKYGIKVKAWRSSSEGVLQRVSAESRAGRFDVDVIQNSAQENEALHRENVLEAVESPYLANVMPEAVQAHREWVGTKVNAFIMAYNTRMIKTEDLPKAYADLVDPKWKGRLGIEANNHHWFATLSQHMGEAAAQTLFTKIVETNGISVRRGHSLLSNMVASGEVPLSLTVYDWNIGPLKKKGAPIDGFMLPPTVAQFDTMAIHKRAPHPNAARLFYDFVLSDEGQQLIASTDAIAVGKKFESPYTKAALKFVDPAKALDMNDTWRKTFEGIVTKKAK